MATQGKVELELQEQGGDLFNYTPELPAQRDDDYHPARVIRYITTNGTIKKNGACVMGAGCAKQAAMKLPWLPAKVGSLLTIYGNVPLLLQPRELMDSSHPMFRQQAKELIQIVGRNGALGTFPVKHEWHQRADIDLIRESFQQIAKHAVTQSGYYTHTFIIMPRPGCGNGKLHWNNVKPVMQEVLNNEAKKYDYGRRLERVTFIAMHPNGRAL